MITLGPDDKAVLQFLDAVYRSDENYCIFASIADETGLKRERVRFICRRLARAGLTEYSRGLWNYDGKPAGAGYCITQAGHNAIKPKANP